MGMPVGKYKKPNSFLVKENVVTVLCKNGSFICDLEDWEKLKHMRWILNSYGYVTTKIYGTMVKGKRTTGTRFFHKMIHNYKICDHINRNPCDNRKINLRSATSYESSMNRGRQKNSSSPYKGIVKYGRDKIRWRTQITVKGKKISSNGYISPIEAALAYNLIAKHYFGVFAYLNPVHFA